jgi:hypothetical protein
MCDGVAYACWLDPLTLALAGHSCNGRSMQRGGMFERPAVRRQTPRSEIGARSSPRSLETVAADLAIVNDDVEAFARVWRREVFVGFVYLFVSDVAIEQSGRL